MAGGQTIISGSAVTKPKRVICRMTEPLESQAVCLFRRHQHSPQ